MFIELVDTLRCLRSHELDWLVATSFEMVERDIVSGVLGCPVCSTRYPIERGAADFRDGGSSPVAAPGEERAAYGAAPELAMRAAALLELAEPGGVVVLAGEWGAAAHELVGLVERIHVLVLDPPADVESGGGVSLALTSAQVPLRPAAARGIALGESHAGHKYLATAADALRPGGRLIAPVHAPIPDGLSELARDEHCWLAVKEGTRGGMVQLRVVR